MSTPLNDRDQLLDLLAREATEGLSAAERAQLEDLLRAQTELKIDEFEASAAALTVAAELDPATKSEAMPEALAARILASAPVKSSSAHVVPLPQQRATRSRSRTEQSGWWAAAACLILAVWGWWPRLIGVHEVAPATAQLTAEQQREALVKSGRVVRASWSPGTDPAANAIQGDVVFDPVTQRGYLRFRGIPANDPRLAQYQLWIADADRKQPQPVDGGVFNVNAPQTTAQGDVIIPFEAKLQVGKPAAFVVTVEQPGGVVVSSQQRVLALAKVPSAQ